MHLVDKVFENELLPPLIQQAREGTGIADLDKLERSVKSTMIRLQERLDPYSRDGWHQDFISGAMRYHDLCDSGTPKKQAELIAWYIPDIRIPIGKRSLAYYLFVTNSR